MVNHLFILSSASMATIPFPLLQANAAAEYRFHSPSRNIYCSMTSDTLSCDVSGHAWKLWGCSDAGCFGHRFTLPANGAAHARRSSDSMIGFTTRTLGYGFRITNGRLACESRQDGLTCTNQHGNRMHLNGNFYELK
jgi:hypothetical protein